jgi:hypothetical protein
MSEMIFDKDYSHTNIIDVQDDISVILLKELSSNNTKNYRIIIIKEDDDEEPINREL